MPATAGKLSNGQAFKSQRSRSPNQRENSSCAPCSSW